MPEKLGAAPWVKWPPWAKLIPKVEAGFDHTDLAKRGSYLAKGIEIMYDEVYTQHAAETVVFGVGIDHAIDQQGDRPTPSFTYPMSISAHMLPRPALAANHRHAPQAHGPLRQ